MDSIRIDTGGVRLMVNGDPQRVIAFNPHDVVFAERFYALLGEFKGAEQYFLERAQALDAVTEKDDAGLPVNAGERIKLIREICEWTREKIDAVFGKGTAQAAFGDSMSLDMFGQFFEGVTPYIEKERSKKISQYSKVVKDRKDIEDSKRVME